MSVARYSFSILCCLVALAAHAEDREARQWLERMSQSLATRSYEGRFFHVRQSRTESLRIFHRVDRGKVTERVVSLDGSGREIIRNEKEVICYLPDKRQVLIGKRTDDSTLLATIPSYNERLESWYSIERGPATKAFGRRTQIILVKPRDRFRYGYRLWLDHETAMPLQSQLYDPKGNVIEQILFAELHFRDRIPADSLKPAVDAQGFQQVRLDAQQPSAPVNAARWNIRAPAGFRLTAFRVQIIAGSNTPVQQLVYSDGLASISVFIEPRSPQTEGMQGLAKVGAAFAFSRNIDGQKVTAVGAVPPATLEVIATGVTQDTAAAATTSEPPTSTR